MTTGDKVGETGDQYLVRFNIGQRVEHIIVMLTFVTLVVTGLSQTYYQSGWGEWVILHMGGIANTRLIHRIFGIIFACSLVYHMGTIIFRLVRRRCDLSMLPTLKDVRDMVAMYKYYLGLSAHRPRFDRYDYKQKFEYIGIIFGGVVMIVTGFVLFFPIEVTHVLPGELVPVAKEFHRNEAVLALLIIVIWHLHSVILHAGIFPLDSSIFTGKISKKRMLEEHPLEYERLFYKVEKVEEQPLAALPPQDSLR